MRRSRSIFMLVALLGLALLLALPLALAHAGPTSGYELRWFTFDSGGGMSVSGGYRLDGTIGQAEAGPTLRGTGYELSGGFWPGCCLEDINGTFLYLPMLSR